MANIKSQIKRIQTNEKARLRNSAVKSEIRTAAKKMKLAVAAGQAEEAEAALRATVRLIDKSVSKGVQHKNKAARQKSTLSNLVNGMKK
jgi:small subunit ribosomal protein S20